MNIIEISIVRSVNANSRSPLITGGESNNTSDKAIIKNRIAVNIPEFSMREIGLDFLPDVKSDAYNIPKTSDE